MFVKYGSIKTESPSVFPISSIDKIKSVVLYICMIPKSLARLKKRKKWILTGRTTSHSPINPRVNAEKIKYVSECKIHP